MGGPVGAASGAPFRVKAHGSELEYSMRGRPELGEWARETLARPDATYVGSEHIREVLADVVGHTDRVFDVPPGVDIDRFVLQDRGAALEDLLAEARKDPPNSGDERLPDDGNAQRLAAFLDGLGPLVVYFGKLIEEKGVQVLLEAMRGIDARLVVVGFGPYRSTLESLAPSRTLFTGPREHRPPAARPRVGGTGGYALGEWATSNASPGRSSSRRAATTSRPAPISARTLFLTLASFLGGIGVSQHFLTVAGAKRSRVIGGCVLIRRICKLPRPPAHNLGRKSR